MLSGTDRGKYLILIGIRSTGLSEVGLKLILSFVIALMRAEEHLVITNSFRFFRIFTEIFFAFIVLSIA